MDPRRDGFGHHNPNLNREDDLFYNTLAVDRVIKALFWGRDLSAVEEQFMRLIHLGIIDEREGFDMPMTAATRAMRHMSATVCHGHGNFQDDFLRTFSFLHVHAPYPPFRLLTNLGTHRRQDKTL